MKKGFLGDGVILASIDLSPSNSSQYTGLDFLILFNLLPLNGFEGHVLISDMSRRDIFVYIFAQITSPYGFVLSCSF